MRQAARAESGPTASAASFSTAATATPLQAASYSRADRCEMVVRRHAMQRHGRRRRNLREYRRNRE